MKTDILKYRLLNNVINNIDYDDFLKTDWNNHIYGFESWVLFKEEIAVQIEIYKIEDYYLIKDLKNNVEIEIKCQDLHGLFI